MKRNLIGSAILFACLLGSSLPAQSAASEDTLFEQATRALRQGEQLRVIVTVDAPDVDFEALRQLRLAKAEDEQLIELTSEFETEARAKQLPVAELVRGLGGEIDRHFWIVMAFSATIPPERLDELLVLPGVVQVEADLLLPANLSAATNSNRHNADGCYVLQDDQGRPVDGRDQVVAIIDSGADASTGGAGRPHRMYFVDGDPNNMTGGGIGGSRLLSSQNFSQSGTAEDQVGHGTSTASCAAGEDWNGGGVDDRGMAPKAGIRSLNIDEGGGAFISSMVRAFQALSNHGDVVVANMSYGGDNNPNGSLPKTMDRVVRNDDIVVTLSAGNEGSSLGSAHGSPNAITVGAVNKSKALAGFSTRGILSGRRYPNLVATGVSVVCARNNNENSSSSATGTSFAAPLTAGAVALIRQAIPSADALETKALLYWGCDDVATGSAAGLGVGYMRARKAVIEALAGNVRTVKLDELGATESYYADFNAGEEIRIVGVWERQNINTNNYHDVRATIFNPDNSVLATEGNGNDLFVHFRLDAVQSGTHRIVFEMAAEESGAGDAFVAVAGLNAADPGNEVSLVLPDATTAGGSITANISNGEPNAPFEVYAGFNPGPITIQGVRMDVGPAKRVFAGTLDGSGAASFSANVPSKVAGRTAAVEVVVLGAQPMDSNLELMVVS